MTTRRWITILCVAAACLVTSKPAVAHHAFGAEFDAKRPVLLKGKIVKMEWINPHTWIHVEITKEDGNGICQPLSEANYDLEAHNARPAMALRPGPRR